MASYFLDTSALAKRYIVEQGTQRVVALVEGADRLIVSRLTMVEVTSALARRARTGNLTTDQLSSILNAFETELRDRFAVMELGTPVMTRATDLARVHGLRAADAIQLACALLAGGSRPAEASLTLVSSDEELNGAAAREGLVVLDPK